MGKFYPRSTSCILIKRFADTAAILICIVSNSYYGMPRGQIHINLPPEYPIMYFETTEIKMAAVSAKQSITSLLVSSPQKDPLKVGTRESCVNLSKLFRYDSSLALLFRLVKCCGIVRDCTSIASCYICPKCSHTSRKWIVEILGNFIEIRGKNPDCLRIPPFN